MAGVLRFVDVETGTEVSRATLDNGAITYSGGETAKGVIRQRARDDRSTPVEAFKALVKSGWSNGYIMVALDGYPKRL